MLIMELDGLGEGFEAAAIQKEGTALVLGIKIAAMSTPRAPGETRRGNAGCRGWLCARRGWGFLRERLGGGVGWFGKGRAAGA